MVRMLLALGVAAVVAVAVVAGGGDAGTHRLSAVVPEATNLIAGQDVKAGGGSIGRIEAIKAIDGGRRARIVLAIDDAAWPLPRGTHFTSRWGGTASFYNRHILVTPGPAGGPPLADGATIPPRDFTTPVEVDQLLATFDARVRRDLKSFVNRSGVAFTQARPALRRVLADTPPALTQAAAVMTDVADRRDDLDVVLRRTDGVVDAIHRADPGIATLLTGAAQTFDAIAAEQQGLRDTLQQLPGALRQTQGTLARADGTLSRVGRLAADIGPGVRELRRTAAPAGRLLASLDDVAPQASSALASLKAASPKLTKLLARATTVSPQLGSISDKAVENLKCIRPYTPEIINLLVTWADFLSWGDGKDKVLRATVQNYFPAPINAMPTSPAELKRLFPQIEYGFPRPPGTLAGQPWFQPACGAGPDALDPAKDREARK